jgi:protocatechuate 3,4-dioxygenase beta subunit
MPDAAGQFNANLNMRTNVSRVPNFSVPLTGTGEILLPNIAANPSALNFGAVPVLTAKDLLVQISNTGQATLTVGAIQTSDRHFSLVNAPTTLTIQPRSSAPLTVRFMPDAVGQSDATLTMTTNVPTIPNFSVPLTGAGETGPGVIQGHVRDSTGGPINDATVFVGPTQLSTDSSGFYSLSVDPGVYNVSAVQSGLMPSHDTVTVPALTTVTKDFILVQAEPFTVEGHVVDSEGHPLSGATVRLTESDAGVPGILETTTDSMGFYRITENPGSYDGPYAVDVFASGFEDPNVGIPPIPNGATITQNITVLRIGIISGRVTDANGTPLAGAMVLVGTGIPVVGITTTFQFSAITDSMGHYSINAHPPGSYHVVAADALFEESNPVTVAVNPDTTVSVDFALVRARPGNITGSVTDSDSGDSIAGALVEAIVEPSSELITTRTDISGDFTLSNVPSGRREVAASARFFSRSTQTVTVIAGQTVTADFTLTSTRRRHGGGRPQ